MFKRIKKYTVPHIVGALVILIGWYIAVSYTAMDRLTSPTFSNVTYIGLILIFIGAYLPEIWIAIIDKTED